MSQLAYQNEDGTIQGFGRPRMLDLSLYSPLGHWPLTGSDMTVDVSGNSKTLSNIGTPLRSLGRSGLGLGYRSVDISNRLNRVDGALNIHGAVTVGAWMRPRSFAASVSFSKHLGVGNTLDNNPAYALTAYSAGFDWWHSHDAGVDEILTWSNPDLFKIGVWSFAVGTRASNGLDVNLYVNGYNGQSGTLASPPNGGANATYNPGSGPFYTAVADIQDAFVIPDELPASDISLIYKKSVGLMS